MPFNFSEKKETRAGFGEGLLEVGKENPNVVALCADLTGVLEDGCFCQSISG
ncbi:MAG: hypothetical protein KatS3mg028_0928 [Bacteroidia bacterium]|nr:MAG: hypothetical protein KatS3mg028_0928 [Bacteroidia bacterium]